MCYLSIPLDVTIKSVIAGTITLSLEMPPGSFYLTIRGSSLPPGLDCSLPNQHHFVQSAAHQDQFGSFSICKKRVMETNVLKYICTCPLEGCHKLYIRPWNMQYMENALQFTICEISVSID